MNWFSKEKIISLNGEELAEENLFVRKQILSPTKKTKAFIDKDHVGILLKDGEYHGILQTGKHFLVDKKEKYINVIDLIYVSQIGKVEVKWGTTNKFELREEENIYEVGVRGAFTVKICNVLKAYQTLYDVGTFDIEQFKERLRSRMCNEIQAMLAHCMQENDFYIKDMDENKDAIATSLTPIVSEMFIKDYGLLPITFVIDEIITH